jgi:N,N'-diacetyllegionaminate synthase
MIFNQEIQIADRMVGPGKPVFFIAEAGVNHDGDVEKAKKLIDVAAEAKADAVKFQSFKTDKLIVKGVPKADYHKKTTGDEGDFYDLIKELELSKDAHTLLSDYAKEKGIIFMSTPFDEESADMLFELGVPLFKVDSGNLNNLRLVRHIAEKQRPVILSTGMATVGEIEETLEVIKKTGNKNIILLHCTSNYPPALTDVNLNAMDTMAQQFGTIIGYSDHTSGIPITLAAVAKGARVIEKHITLDRSAKGPDHLASVEPHELKEMVVGIRMIEQALGNSAKKPVEAEKEVAAALRRSVVSTMPISKGTVITKEMVAIKRPGTGLAPKYIDTIIGRKVQRDISKDELITFDKV